METQFEDILHGDSRVREALQENTLILMKDLIENLDDEDFECMQKAQYEGARNANYGDATAMGQLPNYLEREKDSLKTEEARDMAGLGHVLGFSLERHLDSRKQV